jgi:RimJ/RimL family protein N-acetyltransferase
VSEENRAVPDSVIVTERLSLREMTHDDLDDMAALLGDPEVMRFYPRPKTRDDASAWIAWNLDLYRDRGFGLWVVQLRDGGAFVGDCGLTVQRIDGVDEVEIGYHAVPALQGLGYASEAAAACRDAARDRFGVRRLVAIVNPANAPSQAVARRIGLAFEKRATTKSGEQLIFAADL